MKPKILIGIPHQGEVKTDFMMCLLQMFAYTMSHKCDLFEEIDCGIQCAKGSILPQSRDRLAKTAIEGEATHLLFLDSDMVFPADTLVRLLRAQLPVVGCNCPTKSLPTNPTARLAGGQPLRVLEADVASEEDQLTKVWRVGTGILLIDIKVFDTIEAPRFPIRWDAGTEAYVGEDWGFMELLEAADIAVFVDTFLSYQIGHVGDLTYTHEMGNP